MIDIKDLQDFDVTDIGTWVQYQSFSDKNQIKNQRDNLLYTGLKNASGDICFIFTKDICRLNNELTLTARMINVVPTETVIEDEVYYTTKIEGARTTRIRTTELHNGAKIDKDNAYSEYMVKNAFKASKMLNLYGNRVSTDILIKVWNELVHNCCDNDDIRGTRFRDGDIEVGGHTGANPKEIENLMEQWVEFYNSDILDKYPFIKAALLHFAFESIHPFCDGNGRMGRLLLNNYLIGRGVEATRAVSFSMFIDRRRTEYDAAFIQSENIYNDCTPLITYLLQTMYLAFDSALNK
mgnify:CR=1 FL=1